MIIIVLYTIFFISIYGAYIEYLKWKPEEGWVSYYEPSIYDDMG